MKYDMTQRLVLNIFSEEKSFGMKNILQNFDKFMVEI